MTGDSPRLPAAEEAAFRDELARHVRIMLPPHQPGCPALLKPLGECTCEPPERYGDE